MQEVNNVENDNGSKQDGNQPSVRLMKVAKKQSFAIAGIILFFYGLYGLIGYVITSFGGM